ncbi:MAG: chemotaxis protein CheB [Pirellulaceae bacterium]
MTIVGIGFGRWLERPQILFFAAMPADTGAAFVVVVAPLARAQKAILAELIQPAMRRDAGTAGYMETVKLEPNRVYIIPPAANLNTIDTHLRLSDLEPQPHKRATVDHFSARWPIHTTDTPSASC